MFCEGFWKRIIPFVLAFCLNSFIVSVFQKEDVKERKILTENIQEETLSKTIFCQRGTGDSGKSDVGKKLNISYPFKYVKTSNNLNPNSLQIVYNPRPTYTNAARQNQVTGTVALQMVFLASGQVGKISVISGLSDGLTEQAIAAAMQVKFKPAMRDGKPITISKTLTYIFTPIDLQ